MDFQSLSGWWNFEIQSLSVSDLYIFHVFQKDNKHFKRIVKHVYSAEEEVLFMWLLGSVPLKREAAKDIIKNAKLTVLDCLQQNKNAWLHFIDTLRMLLSIEKTLRLIDWREKRDI